MVPITLAFYRCCKATQERDVIPATCTYPLIQNSDANGELICPAPPRVSYNDVTNDVMGRLESDLTFIDEYLLHRAEDLEPDVYKRRLQGGFVISYMEPEFGTCGLTSGPVLPPNEDIADVSFLLCRDIQGSDYYTLNIGEYRNISANWLDEEDNCPLLNSSRSMNSTGLDSDSLVDGFSAGIVQKVVCREESDNRPPALYTANTQQETKMAATVYYNNEVRQYIVQLYRPVWLGACSVLSISLISLA